MSGVTTHTSFDGVEAEWEELAERTHALPFARPLWLRPFRDAFGGHGLELVAVRRDGRLVALAPLVRRGGVLASPTNYHTPAFSFVAEDDDARRAVVEAIFARCRRVDLMYLPQGGPDRAAVAAVAASRGWAVTGTVALRSPWLSLSGAIDDYFDRLEKGRRKDMLRRRRRLAGRGELRHEMHTGADGLDEALADAFRLEGSGWKTEAGTAITSAEETLAFYTALARRMAADGRLRLAFLRHGERRVAVDFGFQVGGSHYSLKSGYDVNYRSDGVGVLLQEDVLRWDWERGVSTYEFLGDAEPHKLIWTNDLRVRVHLRCFSRSLRSRAEHSAWTYGRPLAKRVLARRRR